MINTVTAAGWTAAFVGMLFAISLSLPNQLPEAAITAIVYILGYLSWLGWIIPLDTLLTVATFMFTFNMVLLFIFLAVAFIKRVSGNA